VSVASFQFLGELGAFIPRERRDVCFRYRYAQAATLKQAIESLGVPHTEVGHVLVNGKPATLARTISDNDLIEVSPHEPGAAPFDEPLAFSADAHMGGLARMLRMLGFDTRYENCLEDGLIARQAAAERRVVLTRDRELLKRRQVSRGCYVHALKPQDQLQEVARRYRVVEFMQPFTRCLNCNLRLQPAKPEALRTVPARVQSAHRCFMQCAACGRIYWEGSHWQRMRDMLGGTLRVPLPEHALR
jgi:uncharacterized protein with PIN domain